MIKVLFYTTIFEKGGAERTVLDIINNMNLSKFRVYLLVSRKKGVSYLNQLRKHKNIKYINFGLEDDEDYKAYQYIQKVIDEEKVDICFAPGIFTNFILMDAISISTHKPKVVLRECTYITGRNLNDEMKKKITNDYNRADKIISITKTIENDLVKNYKISKKKFSLISNPLEIDNIQKKSREKVYDKEFKKNGFKIVYPARFVAVKGHTNIITAMRKVVDVYPNTYLYLLGDGEERKNIEKLVSDLNLIDNVVFMGYKENPYKYIAKSDLFILSSLVEGYPHTLLEAMCLKKPIISTNCKTGPKEILKNGKLGYLVRVNDSNQMSNMICKLIKNEKQRYKKVEKAYKYCAFNDAKLITFKYEEVFESLV